MSNHSCILGSHPDTVSVATDEELQDWVTYVPERTCRIEVRDSAWGGFTRHCGNCGADLDCDTRNRQNYCPNCGARVTEADHAQA